MTGLAVIHCPCGLDQWTCPAYVSNRYRLKIRVQKVRGALFCHFLVIHSNNGSYSYGRIYSRLFNILMSLSVLLLMLGA